MPSFDGRVSDVFVATASGLLFGLSLIVAVGPQNIYVIRQGISRRHVALVVTVCSLSDVVLLALGVGGAGVVLDGREWLVTTVGVVGVTFLLGYAVLAARRAVRPAVFETDVEASDVPRSGTVVLLACLAFTWLNPAVYIDTVFVVGPVSHSHGDLRWWFGLGAAVASVLWFVVLGFGARLLAPWFARQTAWRVLDASVALIMLVTAIRIGRDLTW